MTTNSQNYFLQWRLLLYRCNNCQL